MSEQFQRLTPRAIEDLKDRVKMSDLVGRRIDLKKRGHEWIGLCPFHHDKHPSLTVSDQKGFAHCFACNTTVDAVEWLMRQEGMDFIAAIKELERVAGGGIIHRVAAKKESWSPDAPQGLPEEWVGQRWKNAVPSAPMVSRYLASRGLSVGSEMLRYEMGARHKNEETQKVTWWPSMLAPIYQPNGGIYGLHVTYLARDGNGKAPVDPDRRMIGKSGGGFVPLFKSSETLALAEGIETALSVRQACPELPVWAVMSLGNFRIVVPKKVRHLILCADADNGDPEMAAKMMATAEQWHLDRGLGVSLIPADEGKDFNDMIRDAAHD